MNLKEGDMTIEEEIEKIRELSTTKTSIYRHKINEGIIDVYTQFYEAVKGNTAIFVRWRISTHEKARLLIL